MVHRMLAMMSAPAVGFCLASCTAKVTDLQAAKRMVPSTVEKKTPDFILGYDWRWEAPRETVYPSTFVVDKQGVIHYSDMSEAWNAHTQSSRY